MYFMTPVEEQELVVLAFRGDGNISAEEFIAALKQYVRLIRKETIEQLQSNGKS